jgi:putative Holliday junction resolvase
MISKPSMPEEPSQTDLQSQPPGRVLALDVGKKRVGVALTDELRLTVRPLEALKRSSWKKLVADVRALCREFDAKMVVIGLPLRLDGTEGYAAIEARELAHKMHLSLDLQVFVHDERLTSVDAEARLRAEGFDSREIPRYVDSEAAALILNDFISRARSG